VIKILLVEDHVVLRDSLAKVLNGQKDMQVIAETGSACDVLQLCQTYHPDLSLIDVITENNASGISAASELREAFPDIKIIIMTGMPEITFIDSARKAGVDSFVYKNVTSETLIASIRSTMDGYSIYPNNAPSVLPGGLSFTEKELSILKLVCEAKSRSEIAKELAMSEGSVKAVITSILNKTGYDSIMKFAITAVANGYIVPNL
jgi:DNA-binding NarL/FixJ family response regulator